MTAFSSQIAGCLQRFQEGHQRAAFMVLLEADHDVLPELIAAFRAESDCDVRAFLVEVIWQHRQQSVVSFLGEALRDSEPMVWKQALDGLVTLASQAALEILRCARTCKFPHPQDTAEFQSWLEEAIEQADRARTSTA